MKRKAVVVWITAILLVLLVGVGLWYFSGGTEPEGIQLVELAPEDVGLLQLENGKNGVYVEITDPEVIERVVKNLSEARFEKGESIPSSDGFRLSLFLIHRDGSTYRHFTLISTDSLKYQGYRYHVISGALDLDYLDELTKG